MESREGRLLQDHEEVTSVLVPRTLLIAGPLLAAAGAAPDCCAFVFKPLPVGVGEMTCT